MTLEPDALPPVTLLLLAYNQSHFVGQAIAGALAQTYPNLEIVISDDASTDDTFARMQRAVAGYSGPHRLILNRNPRNLGIGGNLNRMVDLSHGELLFIAAGDDVSKPQRCERVVQAWLDSGKTLDLISTGLTDMDESGALHGLIAPTDLATYRNATDWLASPPHVIGAAQAWTRRVYDRFGPLPADTMGEDMLMVFRAILSGGATTLTDALVDYRRGGISRRERTLSAEDVTRRLLKNNRNALAELPQLLSDARAAGQLAAVEKPLTRRLAREVFIKEIFGAPRVAKQIGVAFKASAVPRLVRLRLLTYAAFPWLLSPWFVLKRWLKR
jgi:glycosyltransferase involved in cell wall biosynthesis